MIKCDVIMFTKTLAEFTQNVVDSSSRGRDCGAWGSIYNHIHSSVSTFHLIVKMAVKTIIFFCYLIALVLGDGKFFAGVFYLNCNIEVLSGVT